MEMENGQGGLEVKKHWKIRRKAAGSEDAHRRQARKKWCSFFYIS